MAYFDMEFPEDFLADLLESDVQKIAVEALEKASPELNRAVEQSLDRVSDKGYSTGAMAGSIKATKPKKTRTDAYYVVSRPTGTDKKGVRNMEKAAYLEYGTCKQGARPWLSNAVKNAESAVINTCQQVYNQTVGAK